MNNPITYPSAQVGSRTFISKVYGWMALGLGITGLVAGMVGTNETLISFLLSNKILFYGLIIGELALVIGLSGWINSMTVGAATLAFGTYAAFNGVTMSVIFLVYTASSIASTFFITAGTFAIMSVYGYTTKTDLTKFGNMCMMALIGVILASVVNLFFNNPAIYWATSYLGILIFVGLTAYDTQKIKNIGLSGDMENETGQKLAIMGALALYLDFVNLFLHLLRVMGKRK